jgi:hydrogenase-4 component E
MSFQSNVDAVLVLIVLLNLAMLAVSRLSVVIRLFAWQSVLLAALPPANDALHGELPGIHAVLICIGTLALKVWLVPWILLRIVRTGEVHREVEPFIGFTTSVLVGALIVVASFALARQLPLPARPMSDLLLPVSLATLFIGLFTLVTRVTAITQVVGFLVVENGIFIFGVMLLKLTPLLVELGILLDLFVAVFIMAIVVYHIRREFDHIDTHLLGELKGP